MSFINIIDSALRSSSNVCVGDVDIGVIGTYSSSFLAQVFFESESEVKWSEGHTVGQTEQE